MKTIKTLGALATLALLAFASTGCIQTVKLVTINLGNLSAVNGAASAGKYVDLVAENSTYRDNKDKFRDVSDIAVLGAFRNNLGTAVSADVWVVPAPAGSPLLADLAAVQAAGGVKAWSVALGPNETKTLTWNNSAALFTVAGKGTLKGELRGDALFALYVFGSTGTYDVTATNAAVAVMLNADIGL